MKARRRTRDDGNFTRHSSATSLAVCASADVTEGRLDDRSLAALVLLPDGELCRRCTDALTDLAARVWHTWSTVPDEAVLDVVVTGPDATLASGHGAAELDALELGGTCAQLGVIRIGGDCVADVVLPESFSARELQLACRLLCDVVRLRRQVQQGRQAGRRLRAESLSDSLTGVPNRRAWDEELAERVAAAQGTGRPLCLAVVDLDHFKQVNDGWGHAAGDRLLQAAADALRQSLRQDDFVARLGGDEFGLLLIGLDAEAADAVINRLCQSLPARIAQATPHVTSISIGYSLWLGDGPCAAAALLKAADSARRQAKSQGRNRAVRGVCE